MLIARWKLEGKLHEIIVMVGTDTIRDPICGTDNLRHGLKYCKTPNCDGPELLYDLKTKYLNSYDQLKHIQPTTFKKACQGKSWVVCETSLEINLNFTMPIFSEWVQGFENDFSIKEKLEQLLKALQNKAEIEDKYYAVFIDEMPPEFFEECPDYEEFLEDLQSKHPRIVLFLAISPSGRNLTKPLQIKFLNKGKIFVKHLRTRHRNSLLLSTLLIHLTYRYNDSKCLQKVKKSLFGLRTKLVNVADYDVASKYHCLSPSEDLPLESSNLPNGDVTLWFHNAEEISEIELLKFFKDTYLPENGKVLVSPSQQNLPPHIYRWCVENDWDLVSHGNVTGTERDLVIAFVDDNFGNLEVMSRARKRLIIVTT